VPGRDAVRRLLRGALDRALPGVRWTMQWFLHPRPQKELDPMSNESASEALVAMPLPEMLGSLGRAVAAANMELSKVPGPNGVVMTVTEATVDLNIAISVDTKTTTAASGGLALKAFSVNASYSRSYGFKEEASSKISIKFAVRPPESEAK
jgi:hypothetical protein